MLSEDLLKAQDNNNKKLGKSKILELFTHGIAYANNFDKVRDAINEDPRLATKVIFHLRDVRGGEGRRDIIRTYFRVMIESDAETANRLMKHIPEIGRWTDIIELVAEPAYRDTALELIKDNINDGLLCKWLPREKSSKRAIAAIIREHLEMDAKTYRKHISSKSATVEQQMCSKQWSEINYSHVPSVANVKYMGAFLRNDEDRRRSFIQQALAGRAKVNSSVLYPHNIVDKLKIKSGYWQVDYANSGDTADTCNALWKQLPDFMSEGKGLTMLPIIDTSGSMTVNAPGSNVACLDIAMGLGIYMAERNNGDLKDLWMNFSTEPKLYRLDGDTLSAKINSLDFRNWNGSTDLDKALDLVAEAIKINPKENKVDVITIVSDMEFNGRNVRFNNPATAKAKFEALGIPMPQIVFWQVNGKGNAEMPPMNENNITVINGYSTRILKDIMSGNLQGKTAYESMLEIVEPKYDYISKIYNN